MCGEETPPFWFRAERTAGGHALRLEHDAALTSGADPIVIPLSDGLGATRARRLAERLNRRLGLAAPSAMG